MAISSSRHCPNCGSNHKGKPFAVYEDGYHCFSCGAHKSLENSFADRVPEKESGIEMPAYGVIDIDNLKWLKQYHVTDNMINKHGIYQSSDGSLVFPIVVDGRIVRVNQRWNNPRRDHAQGNFSEKPILTNNKNFVILVEDYISWIRVGETMDCCLLSGTTVKNAIINKLLARYDIIVVWLDNDHDRENNPGQTAAKKIVSRALYQIRKRYGLTDKAVVNIVSDDDPKCYTNSEINTLVKESLYGSDKKSH